MTANLFFSEEEENQAFYIQQKFLISGKDSFWSLFSSSQPSKKLQAFYTVTKT